MDLRKGKRLTPEYLKSRIAATEFETKTSFGQKAMFCHLQLDNGFVIYGSKPSMAIDPANFDKDLGEKYAYDNTFAELWQLFAFSQMESARELDQAKDVIDWRDFLDVIHQASYRDEQTMIAHIGMSFKFKNDGTEFGMTLLVGEDPQQKLVAKIKEHLGIEAVEPKRIIMIAKICHEANRAYCQSVGDDSQTSWTDAPDWQKESAINGVKFHLMGDHPPSASHENWLKDKVSDGWVYGPVKDPIKKEHPCMLPYDALQPEQQSKDYIFRAIVHSFK